MHGLVNVIYIGKTPQSCYKLEKKASNICVYPDQKDPFRALFVKNLCERVSMPMFQLVWRISMRLIITGLINMLIGLDWSILSRLPGFLFKY